MAFSKQIDKRESLRVVTSNDVIEAQDLSGLSLNARKLFYVAVAQCRLGDKEFYDFETTPAELAEMWGIDRSNVYREADRTCDELMKIVITLREKKNKRFQKRHIFERCDYDENAVLRFRLNDEMTEHLLDLKRDFSKPLMWDFMRMRSPYSMAIWHLMQKEMKSFKPMMSSPIEFYVSLEELRKVTGCEKKLKQIGQFKERVLDKALAEIKKNCFVDIHYANRKKGRTVIGFDFTAESLMGTQDMENLPYRLKKHTRKADLLRRRDAGTITPEEEAELEALSSDLKQITLEDFTNNYPL